jgi:hypothetical protein
MIWYGMGWDGIAKQPFRTLDADKLSHLSSRNPCRLTRLKNSLCTDERQLISLKLQICGAQCKDCLDEPPCTICYHHCDTAHTIAGNIFNLTYYFPSRDFLNQAKRILERNEEIQIVE